MEKLDYAKGELQWDNISLTDIARQWGTPVYLYNKRVLQNDFLRIKNSFQPYASIICFALKANSNPTIVRILGDMDAGADIVSMGELFTALKAGIPHDKMVFAGAGKTDEEINFAVKSRLLAINTESEKELEVIEEYAHNMLQKQPALLRVNPDIDAETHPYITTGTNAHKFGINIDRIEEAARFCHTSHSLHFLGLHVHIGSQVSKPEPVNRTFDAVAGLIDRLEKSGIPVDTVDIGGGMPVDYCSDYNRLLGMPEEKDSPGIADALSVWTTAVAKYFDCSKRRILVEPGRAVTARCGILLTKVLYRKKRADKEFLIVDAGMNDFVRPALYGSFHGIVPLKEPGNSRVGVDVVGPICESGDVIGREISLPPCERGDYLAVLTTGAYGFALASNYNMRPKPPEVLIGSDGVECIRPRQRYTDM